LRFSLHPRLYQDKKPNTPADLFLALTTEIKSQLIGQCGHIVTFWHLPLNAAIESFDPIDEFLGFKYFRYHLNAAGGLAKIS